MPFELLGRATVPPVLGVEVLHRGDVAGERHELRAELVAAVGRCAAVSSASTLVSPATSDREEISPRDFFALHIAFLFSPSSSPDTCRGGRWLPDDE